MTVHWRIKEEWESFLLLLLAVDLKGETAAAIMLLQSITEKGYFSADSGKPGMSCMLEVGTSWDSQESEFSIVLLLQHVYFFFPCLPK